MSFDISHILEQWDYQPGQVAVRRFAGKDGVEKIQLRLDLGVLQMNSEGRPDGKRPLGHASLYDYYQSRLYKHLVANGGNDTGFKIKAEDCAKLQFEALQYYQRHNCLWQLEDYAGVMRDTERNIAVCEFAQKHAESEDLSWTLQQFKPQLLMMHTRARATETLRRTIIPRPSSRLRKASSASANFTAKMPATNRRNKTPNCISLKNWLEEVRAHRPLTEREKLERDLNDAVSNEDYEKAAQVRDALRNLKPTE